MDDHALLEIFRLSSIQQLSQAETALLDLETAAGADPSPAVESLFRAVHTVKGDAGAMKQASIAVLCHEVESALTALRGRTSALSRTTVTRLLAVLDGLKQAVNTGQTPSGELLLQGLLDDMAAPCDAPPAQPAPLPDAAGDDASPQDAERESMVFSVHAGQLDSLLAHANDVMMLQSRLAVLAHRDGLREYAALAEELSRRTADLGQTVLAMRMMPLKSVVPKFRRIVRDVAAHTGKEAVLHVLGELTELDKAVVEKLNPPLVHLLRNAVGHGLESPQGRLAAGKPEVGQVRLEALQDGGEIVITLSDDGAGIDTDAVRDKARRMGLLAPDAPCTPEQALELIFHPGFSTSGEVDDISGRGVGLDAVRQALAALSGKVMVESWPGKGTRFTLRMPVSVSIIECLRLRVAEQTFYFPLECVVHCMEDAGLEPGLEAHLGTFAFQNSRKPCLALDVFYGLRERPAGGTLVAARHGEAVFGVCVDEVLGLAQVMVKQLNRGLLKNDCFLGAALNDEGGMSLIVDPRQVIRLLQAED